MEEKGKRRRVREGEGGERGKGREGKKVGTPLFVEKLRPWSKVALCRIILAVANDECLNPHVN